MRSLPTKWIQNIWVDLQWLNDKAATLIVIHYILVPSHVGAQAAQSGPRSFSLFSRQQKSFMFSAFRTKIVKTVNPMFCFFHWVSYEAATTDRAEQVSGYFLCTVGRAIQFDIPDLSFIKHQPDLPPPEAFSSKPHIPIIALPGQVVSQFSAAGNPLSDRRADGQPGTPRRSLWMDPQYAWNLPHILLRYGKAIIVLVLRPTYWHTPESNLLCRMIFPTRPERTGLTFCWFISGSNFSSATLWWGKRTVRKTQQKLRWVWRGRVRAKHPRRIPDRKCEEWIREATSVCTITPLTSGSLWGEEPFPQKWKTQSQVGFFFYVFDFFTTFTQHRFSLKSVTQIPALSGETRKVKGLQSLGRDRHTFERPSLVSSVYTSENIPRKRRNGCNSLSPCSGNLEFSPTERSISSFVLTSFSRYRSWYEPCDSPWNTLRQPHLREVSHL